MGDVALLSRIVITMGGSHRVSLFPITPAARRSELRIRRVNLCAVREGTSILVRDGVLPCLGNHIEFPPLILHTIVGGERGGETRIANLNHKQLGFI